MKLAIIRKAYKGWAVSNSMSDFDELKQLKKDLVTLCNAQHAFS